MSSSKEVNKVEYVKALVKKTNAKFASVEKSNRNLYLQVRDAYDFLGDDKELTKQYENNVKEVHRVTLFLLRKVVTDSRLRKFEEELPSSYQTLYELHKLVNEVGDAKFEELVDLRVVCESTTKKDVVELRKQYRTVTRSNDASNAVTRSNEEPSNVVAMRHEEATDVATRSFDEFVTEVCSLNYEDRVSVAEQVLETLNPSDLERLVTFLSQRLESQELANEREVA